ncbi:aldo/keto reductase [Nitriliruptor alkaliphilus]|uniref:aldo/keto reductase n=1 Tax=Nitriliruptor alkaliphilus TaxID=427918 RepID=UPI0006976BCC|nr:aldo/keto reductase [Nitriliruptor alkaliphilus]
MSDAASVPTVALNDGTTIPQLGFGTFQIPPEDTAEVVGRAFEIGYRHIDTAQMYRNEEGVGRAVAASGIPRDELYITSKLNNSSHAPDDVRRTFEQSLERLGLDHLDLFLIHWPLPNSEVDYVDTWRAVTDLVADGRLRSAGVSNFEPAHLDRIVEATGAAPVVNQIEAHPYFRNDVAREASLRHGTAVQAWGPLGQGALFDDPTLAEVAERNGRTVAQVALRWALQRGDIVFPKSSNPDRMRENLDTLDFELSDDDVATIDGLDRGEDGRGGPHPDQLG